MHKNKRKNKKGLYTFIPITNEYEIYNQIKKNNNKKNLMVELTEAEEKEYNPLLIRKYEESSDGLYKKTYNMDDEYIALINYSTLLNMNMNEIKKGSIVVLEPCITDNNYLYLSSLRNNENSINRIRNELIKKSIGADIYFFTKDEDLLEKYEDGIVQIKEKECNKYELVDYEIYVLDALKNPDLIGFNSSNYLYLNILSSNSIPVYIIENYGDYEITLNDNLQGNKGYIITEPDFKKMIKNDEIQPLLKYINLYKLENGNYKKYPLIKYINTNTLKYKRIEKK